MKNLEQIRARNAWDYANDKEFEKGGQKGGEVIGKIPYMIMNHGFLATAAFGFAEKQRAWRDAFKALAQHLADPDIALVPEDKKDVESLMSYLSREGDSQTLKLVTEEAMAWLHYAKRFVRRT